MVPCFPWEPTLHRVLRSVLSRALPTCLGGSGDRYLQVPRRMESQGTGGEMDQELSFLLELT